MKKRVNIAHSPIQQPPQTDIAGLINRMQQQLFLLDRKVDMLISRSSERPVEGKRFSMGPQRFDRPRRPAELKQDNGYRERVMHKAVCADCNKECEVPFRPSGDRPVYCKECYAKRRSGGPFKGKHDSVPKEAAHAHVRHVERQGAAASRKPAAKKKPTLRRKRS